MSRNRHDAFLWIAAFVFIERNVFEWEKELETGSKDHDSSK